MQHNHVDVEDERVCRSQIENAQKKMRWPGVSDLEESWHFMASNSATFCIGLRQKLVVRCLIMILNIFYFIMQ